MGVSTKFLCVALLATVLITFVTGSSRSAEKEYQICGICHRSSKYVDIARSSLKDWKGKCMDLCSTCHHYNVAMPNGQVHDILTKDADNGAFPLTEGNPTTINSIRKKYG